MGRSEDYIEKKMRGEKLSITEMYTIISDIKNDRLKKLETSLFLYSLDFKGVSKDEIEYLTRAEADSGEKPMFNEPVYDKHSVGGVPGSEVSLLVVSIIASYGLLIPKTSSRAITSAGGTADIAEMLMPVDLSMEDFKRVAYKTKGAIASGIKLNLAPVDDILIRDVSYPFGGESYTQMLTSIMAKKLAVGAKYVVIDIPMGGLKVPDKLVNDVKVPDKEKAKKIARDFKMLGERLDIEVKCLTTYGYHPIGRAVGPALEAKEAWEILHNHDGHSYRTFGLVDKATDLAGTLLKMSGKASSRQIGKRYAEKALANGKALEKMKEIIEEQGGDPGIRPEDIKIGRYESVICAKRDGKIIGIDNKAITEIARAAGAPSDKGAGIFLPRKADTVVNSGDELMLIYAERKSRLEMALKTAKKTKPIIVSGITLESY